jgi:hypothetical protein
LKNHVIRIKQRRNETPHAVVSIILLLSSVLGYPACHGAGSADASRRKPSAAIPSASAVATEQALAAELCSGRARCSLRARRTVGAGPTELAELALEHEPGTEGCDGGEYWLVRPTATPRLQRLATDCNAQLSADSPGHATVRLSSTALLLDYQELQASDRCSGSSAELNVPASHLLRETRFAGASHGRECRREDELSTDWDTSDHVARWSQVDCDAKGVGSRTAAGFGAAIPKYSLPSSAPVTAVGSCGVKIDAVRAARWQKPAPVIPQLEMRAAVVNDTLLIDIDGSVRGSLTLIVASAGLGDSAYGSVGCASEAERRLSSTSIRLDDGHVDSSGPQAPFLKISARTANSIQLSTASIAGIARAALSYRGPAAERLDSANLKNRPAAADLPPFDVEFQASDPCQVVDGRLEVRPANATRDPVFVLR